MKKILAVLVVVTIAGVVNAASFTWGTDDSRNTLNPPPLSDGWTSPTTDFYLVYLGTSAATIADGEWNSSTSLPTEGVIRTGSTGTGYVFADGKASYTYTESETTINGYYALIVVDAATPTKFGAYNFQASGLSDIGTPVNYTAPSTDAAQFTAVPEPMSLALFGLGAGVIGLRRRFKNKKA